MHVQKHNGDPWYRCALYEVWRDMMKTGRKLFNQRLTDGTGDGFPVDPLFRDYDRFVLWARVCQHYKMGEMDHYRIERKSLSKGFSPDNCFFTTEPPAYLMAPAEISPGAQCEWKAKKLTERKELYGLSKTRLYDIWRGMVRRCTDPGCKDWPDYGGRGITVCDEWRLDFLTFYEWAWEHGYSPALSIERRDVDGDYCPQNCRWASDLEQRLNTRAYAGMYTNLRLKVSDMRGVLAQMKDNVVVTLIVRTSYLPTERQEEADYPAVQEADRIDVIRKRRRKNDRR